eukprot:5842613-Prymnesium_polylepis.1
MPDVQTLARVCGCIAVTFAQCMFGSEAQKYTTFLYSPGMHAMLQSLDTQSCQHGPGAHQHAGGSRKRDGSWESADFAAFSPALNYFLAQAMARLGQQHAIRDRAPPHGTRPPPSPPNFQLPSPGPQVGDADAND